jgi:hypothetical protein
MRRNDHLQRRNRNQKSSRLSNKVNKYNLKKHFLHLVYEPSPAFK